jgi:hypothetical protein
MGAFNLGDAIHSAYPFVDVCSVRPVRSSFFSLSRFQARLAFERSLKPDFALLRLHARPMDGRSHNRIELITRFLRGVRCSIPQLPNEFVILFSVVARRQSLCSYKFHKGQCLGFPTLTQEALHGGISSAIHQRGLSMVQRAKYNFLLLHMYRPSRFLCGIWLSGFRIWTDEVFCDGGESGGGGGDRIQNSLRYDFARGALFSGNQQLSSRQPVDGSSRLHLGKEVASPAGNRDRDPVCVVNRKERFRPAQVVALAGVASQEFIERIFAAGERYSIMFLVDRLFVPYRRLWPLLQRSSRCQQSCVVFNRYSRHGRDSP